MDSPVESFINRLVLERANECGISPEEFRQSSVVGNIVSDVDSRTRGFLSSVELREYSNQVMANVKSAADLSDAKEHLEFFRSQALVVIQRELLIEFLKIRLLEVLSKASDSRACKQWACANW